MNRTSSRHASRITFAPFAGSLHSTDGELVVHLIARYDRTAITALGQLVLIDRPSEWIDHTFTSWQEMPLNNLSADGMANAIAIVEHLLQLPRGTLGAENLAASLLAAAAAVNLSLMGLRERLGLDAPVTPSR